MKGQGRILKNFKEDFFFSVEYDVTRTGTLFNRIRWAKNTRWEKEASDRPSFFIPHPGLQWLVEKGKRTEALQ